jgi:hypothetical protein
VLNIADEGPRDDAADPQGIAQAARDAAHLVEPLEAEGVLVRGDLKNAVDGRVADRLAGAHVLGSEFVEDDGAGGVPVAEDAGQSGFAHERSREFARESGLRVRKVAPLEGDRHAGDLPVARRRVFAFGGFDAEAPSPGHGSRWRKVRRQTTGRGLAGEAKSEFSEIRQPKRSIAQTVAVPLPARAGLGDVPDRVGARVAIGARILGTADADRVEHDEERAGHQRCHPPLEGEGRRCAAAAGWGDTLAEKGATALSRSP